MPYSVLVISNSTESSTFLWTLFFWRKLNLPCFLFNTSFTVSALVNCISSLFNLRNVCENLTFIKFWFEGMYFLTVTFNKICFFQALNCLLLLCTYIHRTEGWISSRSPFLNAYHQEESQHFSHSLPFFHSFFITFSL